MAGYLVEKAVVESVVAEVLESVENLVASWADQKVALMGF